MRVISQAKVQVGAGDQCCEVVNVERELVTGGSLRDLCQCQVAIIIDTNHLCSTVWTLGLEVKHLGWGHVTLECAL